MDIGESIVRGLAIDKPLQMHSASSSAPIATQDQELVSRKEVGQGGGKDLLGVHSPKLQGHITKYGRTDLVVEGGNGVLYALIGPYIARGAMMLLGESVQQNRVDIVPHPEGEYLQLVACRFPYVF
jgi:hypothetical protein